MRTALIFILTLLAFRVHGGEPTVDIRVADMDRDGVADSLIYNRDSMVLAIKLSSQGYLPYDVHYPGEYETGVYINAFEGGFTASSPHMRANNVHTYSYERGTGRFLLAGYFHDHIHCGSMNVDLEDRLFSAEWFQSFPFTGIDSLVVYPRVEFPIDHDPVYLGEQHPDLMSMGYDLLRDLESIYTPPTVDTVRFAEVVCEYDENEPSPWDDCCDIIYTDNKGFRHRVTFASDQPCPARGDRVEITRGYVFCHDTVDGRYLVAPAVTGIGLVEPGKIWSFNESNAKPINLHNEAGWSEGTGELVYDGVMYFLVTDNDRVKEYMDKPGSLEVYYSNSDRGQLWLREWNIGIVIDIYNRHDQRSEHVDKVVLGITPYRELLYYRYNAGTGALDLLEREEH